MTVIDKDTSGAEYEGAEEPAAAKSFEKNADGEMSAAIEAETDEKQEADAGARPTRRLRWTAIVAYGLLPSLALLLGLGCGYLKWMDSSAMDTQAAGAQAAHAAADTTAALLSYKPEAVDKELGAAGDRLTGTFKESYVQLIRTVVIPGAKQKQVSAVATVAAAAAVSANPRHAVVLLFVNQTTTVGSDPPTESASVVRATLDKEGNQWLVSDFTPI